MAKTKNIPRCNTCKYWKTGQAALHFSPFYGICVCYKWKFTTGSEDDIRIFDRKNLSGKHMDTHTFESTSIEVPIGAVDSSRYCFVTEMGFGCIHHKKKK